MACGGVHLQGDTVPDFLGGELSCKEEALTHSLLCDILHNEDDLHPSSVPGTFCASDFIVIQSLSPVRLFGTSWTVVHQARLSSTVSQSLLKLMSNRVGDGI